MPLPTPKRVKGLLELMDEALDMDAAKEAVLRLGLKADSTAADRAKAMGFSDDTYYHGTDKTFDEFDLTKSSYDNLGKDWGSRAVFVAPDAKLANLWSKLPQEKYLNLGNFPAYDKFLTNQFKTKSPQVLPLKIRNNNLFDYKNPEHIKQMQKLLPENISDAKLKGIKKGNWKHIEDNNIQKSIRNNLFDGFHVKENVNDNVTKGIGMFNPANIRSIFARFNPKYAGIGAGSIMSSNLLANEKHEGGLLGENVDIDNLMRENLSRILSERKLKDDIAKYGAIKPIDRNYFFGELADSMKRFTSLDRDPTGASNMFFGGGAKALDDLSYGMTPMQQMPGKIPAIPTNEAMLNLMELIGL